MGEWIGELVDLGDGQRSDDSGSSGGSTKRHIHVRGMISGRERALEGEWIWVRIPRYRTQERAYEQSKESKSCSFPHV